MALSIHTNYSALVTQTNLSKTNSKLATNQQRLGTGFRVNSAADDAAGLQIATRLDGQSRGMAVASRNVNDAVSLLQTSEGAFSELTDIVQRMKDLATQGANGTNSTNDSKALQAEYDELGKEMGNIINNTSYAGTKLFTAAGMFGAGAVSFQIGASGSQTLSLNASGNLNAVTGALSGISTTFTNATGAGTEINSVAGATATIDKLAAALDNIGTLRAQFGANINRLNHTANNLANMKDNTDVAKGTIMDADFASESASMTKNSMLMQSGISMLKQAGQMPGMVMSLLG
ncbi:lateral flagellin LafA [Pseudomonas knackmussii]|uniref:lateral flagellin LafA n=1 Tax=Pseudomonas knackmussii TaxID=65741 RepID=UPI00136385A4|nr:lateral flagellin LafA [Pseudomonas knackmussii]